MTSLAKLRNLQEKHGSAFASLIRDPVFFIRNVSWGNPTPLTPYQVEMIRTMHQNSLTLIEAFRSSGKTAAVNQYIVRCMVSERGYDKKGWRGYIAGDAKEQASNALRDVRLTFESNPVLRKYIPKSRNMSWGKTEIELTNGAWVKIKPFSERTRSEHVDFVFLDEVGLYRSHEVLFGAVMPTVQARRGKIVAAGTPMSELDLIHILQANKQWKYLRYAADDMYVWEKDDDPYFKELNGRNLYEIRYPDKKLADKKEEIGNVISFAREYLLRIMGGGDELYPYWLVEQSFDYTMSFLEKRRDDMGLQYFMGLDFALSTSTSADYSAYCILERNNATKKVTLVRLEVYHGKSYAWQKQRIKELHGLFHCSRILADEGTFGKTFLTDLRADALPITGFTFQHNRQELLEVLRSAFELNFSGEKDSGGNLAPREHSTKGFIICKNRSDVMTHKVTEVLINQLMHFVVRYVSSIDGKDRGGHVKFDCTLKHDDLVMALALAYYVRSSEGDRDADHRTQSWWLDASGELSDVVHLFQGGITMGREFIEGKTVSGCDDEFFVTNTATREKVIAMFAECLDDAGMWIRLRGTDIDEKYVYTEQIAIAAEMFRQRGVHGWEVR